MANIFVVEDDMDIREITLYALRSAGFEGQGFECGKDFFAALDKQTTLPDLVILDIMLPGDDGLKILDKIRQSPRYQGLYVFMLTAKGSELDKIKGLDSGADDYITKPFSIMELISRIKAILRRSQIAQPIGGALSYQNLRLDHEQRAVFVDEMPVNLTFKEYELLHYLLLNKGMALSRDKIMEVVWGYDFEGESRTVDTHIKSLRQKLGEAGAYVVTLRNVGYKLGG